MIGKVADDARKRGEPQLASLYVQADLTIGAVYSGVAAGTDARTRELALLHGRARGADLQGLRRTAA